MLLNRRGWSNFLTCRSCGHVWECPDCDVDARPAPRRGRRSPATTAATASAIPTRCPDCGSVSIARHGTGTERLEHELAALGTPVFRLDADIARRRRACSRAFERRRARDARRHADGRQGPRLPRRRRSASCSTPTRRCASPTSAPRSARSRSSRSSPGAPGAGGRGRVLVQTLARRAGASSLAAQPRRRRLPRRGARAPPRAALPAVLDADPDRLLVGGRRRAAAAAADRASARAPARRARPGAAVPPARHASAARSSSRPPTAPRAIAAVGAAVARSRADRAHRGVALQRRRRPAVAERRRRDDRCTASVQPRPQHARRARRGTASRRRSTPRSPRGARAALAHVAQVRRPGADAPRRAPVDRFDDALRAEIARDGRS